MDPLEALLTPAQRAAIRDPIEAARTLPRQAFTSEAFFQCEVERIFSRHWTALCFSHHVPECGDLLPLELCGIPLLVVRGDDGEARVFHNIVPYDSCLAVIEPAQRQQEIVTPYHGWHYDLRGKLTAMPYWDGTKQGNLAALQGRLGDLLPVCSGVACGVVFVNLSSAAAPLHAHLAPLYRALEAYRVDDLEIGRDADGMPLLDQEDLATNWKTFYENWAINVLHEGFVHEFYAQSPQIPRVNEQGEKTYVEHIDEGLMALYYQEEAFRETYPQDLSFAPLGVTPESCPAQAWIGSLFPNLHLAVFPQYIYLIIALPETPGRTRTVRALFYEPTSATNSDCLEERLDLLQGFSEAASEDGRITQAVQKARHSPVCEQQFYSPFWDTMHYRFSNMVLDALEQHGTGR